MLFFFKKYGKIIILISSLCFSQENDKFYFSGNLNINNNGIDWVPIFSRDKPSLIANFSFGNERLSVRPLIRYELNGFQPWGFDIWWNYIIKSSGKFNVSIGGVFPGVVNQKVFIKDNNLPNFILQPWVSAIINPSISFIFNKYFSLNLSYYEIIPLKIVNKTQIESGRIFILSPVLKELIIKKKFFLKWEPMVYSVQLEKTRTGIFSAQTINIGLLNFPISLSSVMNKPIFFGDLSGKKFDWNLGLNYSFKMELLNQKRKNQSDN